MTRSVATLQLLGLAYRLEQPSQVTWEGAVLDWKHLVEATMAPTTDAKMVAGLIERYRIGGAYIKAFGPGHLLSVVNMDEDPNSRINPRALINPHVSNLSNAFLVPGAKRDYESPIFLLVRRELLTPSLIKEMQDCKLRDPSSAVPLLELRHENSEELHRLELQLLLSVKDKSWMTDEERNKITAQLTALRKASSRAVMVNGSHRAAALIEIGAGLDREYRELQDLVRSGSVSQDDITEKVGNIFSRVSMASYRVEVFDGERCSPQCWFSSYLNTFLCSKLTGRASQLPRA